MTLSTAQIDKIILESKTVNELMEKIKYDFYELNDLAIIKKYIPWGQGAILPGNIKDKIKRSATLEYKSNLNGSYDLKFPEHIWKLFNRLLELEFEEESKLNMNPNIQIDGFMIYGKKILWKLRNWRKVNQHWNSRDLSLTDKIIYKFIAR